MQENWQVATNKHKNELQKNKIKKQIKEKRQRDQQYEQTKVNPGSSPLLQAASISRSPEWLRAQSCKRSYYIMTNALREDLENVEVNWKEKLPWCDQQKFGLRKHWLEQQLLLEENCKIKK